MRPIKIIGGGLAGLSLGASLQEAGVPTTIEEAGTYPRHKVCGEFISGLASQDSDRLGLSSALADARLLSSVAWMQRGRATARYQLPQPALGLSRYVLDVRLMERFQRAGGNLQTGRRARLQDDGPGTVRTSGHRASPSDYIGLKAHITGLAQQADLEMHLGDRAYVGLSPVDHNTFNLCGLFRRRSIRGSIPDMLDRYLRESGLDELAESVQTAEMVKGSPCAVAGLAYETAPAEGLGIALGDARQLIPPFTGAGMATAFATAAEALQPIMSYAEGQLSWEQVRKQVHERLSRRLSIRLKTARMLHPFLLNPVRQSLVIVLARLNLLPFSALYRLTHH